MRRHYHVHLVRDIRKLQRLDRVMLPRVVRKILLHRPAVDGELTATRTQEHARHRLLAPPCSQKPSLCARDGRARRTQCSSSRLDDCPAAISIPVRAAANILSAACGSISNFTSAYSPLRHHLEGTATCGKKQIPLTAKQPGASAPRAAPNPRHPGRYATSSHAARATYSSAACREPLRGSSSPTWTRAAFSPVLPSTRRDIRCANNKLFARPWSPAAPAPRSWRQRQTSWRPLLALRPLHPWLRTSSLRSVTPFPIETNSNLRVVRRTCQPKARVCKSLLTSYPPSGVEVFERKEAVGDGRPAGWRAGQRENASS